jgi:hypothetical protein
MQTFFTKHAHDKVEVLARHGFSVTEQAATETVASPDTFDTSRTPLLIAEKTVSATHSLRVAYKIENEVTMIITLYPVRKKTDEPGTGN